MRAFPTPDQVLQRPRSRSCTKSEGRHALLMCSGPRYRLTQRCQTTTPNALYCTGDDQHSDVRGEDRMIVPMAKKASAAR